MTRRSNAINILKAKQAREVVERLINPVLPIRQLEREIIELSQTLGPDNHKVKLKKRELADRKARF